MRLLDLLVQLDAQPKLQGAINAVFLAVTGLLALAPLIKKDASPRRVLLKRAWLFYGFMAVSLFSWRYPAFFYPTRFDPDEAQMLAGAITYQSHPVPWRDVDTGTAGPIDTYILLWPRVIGLEPNYVTSRVLELLLMLGTLIFLHATVRRAAGDLAARLALLPTFAFLCLTNSGHFIHYSTEELSLFLMAWALWLITKWRFSPATLFSSGAVGLMLGMLPFAKSQSVLLGGFLGLVAIRFLWTSRHLARRAAAIRIALLAASSLVPGALILSVVAWAGALNDFWQPYVHMGGAYGNVYPTWWETIHVKFSLTAGFLGPDSIAAFPVCLGVIATLAADLHILAGKQKLSPPQRSWFVFGHLFFLTALATVVYTGRSYSHYQYYLLTPLAFLLALVLRLARLERSAGALAGPVLRAALFTGLLITLYLVFRHWSHPRLSILLLWLFGFILTLTVVAEAWASSSSQRVSFLPPRWQGWLPLAGLVPLFVLPLVDLALRPNLYRGQMAAFLARPRPPMEEAILRDRPPGGRLAIWGWAPELVADTGSVLGTRDAVVGDFMFLPNPLQPYYRDRYLRDLRANRPELFLEAVGPDNNDNIFTDPQLYGIQKFPELAQLIAAQYRLDREIDGMRLFIRKDLPASGSNP